MQAIPLIITGISTLFGVYSAFSQAQAQEKMANYNARMAEYQAEANRRNAQAAQNAAAYQEDRHRERARKLMSSMRSLYGASGVAEEGTPLLVMEESAANAELDAQAIRYQGNVQSMQYTSQAALDKMEANLYRMRGKQAQTAGWWTAGSGLLTGASTFYDQGRTAGYW